jgi:signal transduction histidine kinase/CHASE3 domain sensor protein
MKITSFAAILALFITVCILIGWVFLLPEKNLVSPGLSVRFNTALCLSLSAVSLLFLDQPNFSWKKKYFVIGCTGFVLLIVLITLSQYIFNYNAGIDQLFWKAETVPGNVFPGRMTVATAVLLLLLSLVHLLLLYRRFFVFVQVTLIAGFVLLSLVFLASLSQVSFSRFSLFHASTIHSSLAFLLLYVGSFFSYPLRHLRFSFERKMVASFSFIILLLTIVFFSFRGTNKKFYNAFNRVTHTHEVLLESERIAASTVQMQNHIRGYFLTGHEAFLRSFTDAAALATGQINTLKSLTQDDARQQSRIDSLQKMVVHYIESRNEIARLHTQPALHEAALRKAAEDGQQQTDMIQSVIADVQQHENRLLTKRKAESEQSINSSSKAIGLFQVIIVLLLVLAFVVVFRNTRKRRKAEEEVLNMNQELEKRVEEKTKEAIEKEKQYRFLVENMQEGIQVIGTDWRYQLVNNAYMQQRVGVPEQLTGHTIMEKNRGIEDTELFGLLQHCMKERKPARFEYANEKGFYELSIEPVPEGLFILSMDITERKKYLEELKKSEARLARAQKIARLARWEWNADTGLVDPSRELLELLDQAAGKPFSTADFYMLIHTDDRALFKKELEVALENQIHLNCEFRICTGREEIKYLHIVSEISCSEAGEPTGFTGTLQDVTELKRSEFMLKQLNENLEKRAVELRTSNSELERFAFVASHDLQEPLRMVSSFLNLLQAEAGGQLDEVAKEYIRFAVDGAERMKKLIQALLEYSRLGVSKETISRVDCTEVVKHIQNLFELRIRELNARLCIHPLPQIDAVESQLEQVFQNLIGNALKYHGHEPLQIDIGCTDRGAFWEFYVRDNGIGIDPKYFDKIFIIFQRLHNKTQYSGTGIGLAICKKIVEKHGGNIWVQSEPKKGSTFYFTISKNTE